MVTQVLSTLPIVSRLRRTISSIDKIVTFDLVNSGNWTTLNLSAKKRCKGDGDEVTKS